jgi:DNA-binding transcriptional regulator YhcF (GntR family)
MVDQLVQMLSVEIADGRRPAGSTLPSVRALAVEVGCAPGTVSRAYGALRGRGIGRALASPTTVRCGRGRG